MVPGGAGGDSEGPTSPPEAPMLMLVLDNETPAELAVRRRELEQTVAAIAAAPVRHLPASFLAAVDGLFWDDPAADRAAER
jgi:hypothetical protein